MYSYTVSKMLRMHLYHFRWKCYSFREMKALGLGSVLRLWSFTSWYFGCKWCWFVFSSSPWAYANQLNQCRIFTVARLEDNWQPWLERCQEILASYWVQKGAEGWWSIRRAAASQLERLNCSKQQRKKTQQQSSTMLYKGQTRCELIWKINC